MEYHIEYHPKDMYVDAGEFNPSRDFEVETELRTTSGDTVTNQPEKTSVRLLNGNETVLEESFKSTDFTIPSEYLSSDEKYSLMISYYGYEFNGWSNEIQVDFGKGVDGLSIRSTSDRPPTSVVDKLSQSFENTVSGEGFADASRGFFGLIIDGWSNVPGFSNIIDAVEQFINDNFGGR
jgi:hypothetical protein